jgi:hypothetical protein
MPDRGCGARLLQREENGDQRQDFCKEVQENADEEAGILAGDASTGGNARACRSTTKRPERIASVRIVFARLAAGAIFRCRTG